MASAKAVDEGIEMVERGSGPPDTLPLILRPRNGQDASWMRLKQWVTEHKHWLDEQMLQYGALLFRGFDVTDGYQFQEVVQAFQPNLCDGYRGTSPRKLVPGTKYVFTASELPPSYPIPQHLEMSFLPAPPKNIFFGCLTKPAWGGETPLCDYRKVYEQLSPQVRKEFEEKGVMYIRNYPATKGWFSEPLLMKGWVDLFQSSDKKEIEEELNKSQIDYKWKENDFLTVSNRASAVEVHPDSGDKIWFNHTAVLHWSMFHQELHHIYLRVGSVRYLLYSWLMWILQMLTVTWKGPKNMAMHTCYGNGDEIPEKDVAHVRSVIYNNMVFNRWEQGDILMIDNFRISHGRQPYLGKRKIVVSWSKPQLKPSFQQGKPDRASR